MKIKALLSLIICTALVAVSVAACKRREQTYAGVEGPKATETVQANAQY